MSCSWVYNEEVGALVSSQKLQNPTTVIDTMNWAMLDAVKVC
jgi:hypothetical protein